MRILIAEDDPVSRLLLDATLVKWGYETVVCSDGRQALSKLEADAPPEIAILDWMMPGLDGPDVCRQLRQRVSSRPTYIILLTAKTQREDIVAGLEAGADDYVSKPFYRPELYACLQSGLRIIELQRKLAAQVQDLEVVLMRLRRVQQAQKLEAIGQLAAGVAHEINTPIQYIGDNMRFLQESWKQIRQILPANSPELEIGYLLDEMPCAIDQSLEGVVRVSKIIRAMRDFSHPSSENKVATDINRAIETTIAVATSEWKYVADVQTDLDPRLPAVVCLPGELHQVLLNLLVNAAHAAGEVMEQTSRKGRIRFTTSVAGDCVEIRVSDTGAGIPEEHRGKVFEPFFTTKEVGKGTGQGLAIAHSVVVQQHNGKIWFETEVGKGTTFIIQLPIAERGTPKGEPHEANLVC